MKNLSHKIELYLGRTPNFREEVKLQDDGDGAYISFWSDSVEKSKPTDEQLNAFESDATKLENNLKIDAKRRTEYLSWQEQLEMIDYNAIRKIFLEPEVATVKKIEFGEVKY